MIVRDVSGFRLRLEKNRLIEVDLGSDGARWYVLLCSLATAPYGDDSIPLGFIAYEQPGYGGQYRFKENIIGCHEFEPKVFQQIIRFAKASLKLKKPVKKTKRRKRITTRRRNSWTDYNPSKR